MTQLTTAFLGVAHPHTSGFVNMLNTRHAAGEVTVGAVCAHDHAEAHAWADKIAGKPPVRTVDEILGDRSIRSVVICAENARHKDLAVASAWAGKDIFCEKPLGLGAADAAAIAGAIKEAGVTFQTGYFQRGLPVNQFIRREVAAGNLGKLTRAHYTNAHGAVLLGWFDTACRWLTDPAEAGGGGLLDMGAHPLDLILSTFSGTEGAVTSASAVISNHVGRYGKAADECGTALLGFASGFAATFSAGWLESGPLSEPTSVFGTEGQIVVRPEGVFYQSNHIPGRDGQTPIPAAEMPPAAPHAFELFWEALLGRPLAVPLVPVDEAALGSAVMERLYASAGLRRAG